MISKNYKRLNPTEADVTNPLRRSKNYTVHTNVHYILSQGLFYCPEKTIAFNFKNGSWVSYVLSH
jgi:ribulose bisphosphate carboxylase small subunit